MANRLTATNLRIGLWNLEPKIENTALMQVSQYHKQQGDHVEFYSPLFEYDKVYVFSLFSFTKKPLLKPNMIAGGTGFNICSRLPIEIEACDLDYSIYPHCKTSYLWFSRGCFRNCPFCVVPTKEGKIYPVEPKNLNPNGKYISIMDNNFFADLQYHEAIEYLLDVDQPVLFQSGLDVRTLGELELRKLAELKIYKQLHIAWDNPRQDLTKQIERLKLYVPHHKIMCYVLIGYWSSPDEDLMRVEKLRELKIDPFVMPYNRSDPYQKAFARWVNHKATFKSICWKDYKHGSWKGLEVMVPLLNHAQPTK